MPTISTLTAVLQLDKSGFESSIGEAQDDLDGLQGTAQRTGQRLTSAGKTMTAGITAPLAAMGALSARTAASFDQNMQKSIAVMGDVSESMREDLEQTAREVANTTTMSADQAAESYYFLASAGLDATQAMEAMPQVAAFAEAGQMDMAEATDVATNVMSAYNLEAENMSDVTDVMTATVTNHNQTLQGMSAAFRNAAPAAASMGVEIEELAALTGALGDVGIQAEEAGTALNSMMRRMSKRSGEAGQALDELGIQTTNANGELLPMIQIIEQLENANMSSAQAAAIFGRQMSAGTALVDAGADSLREYQSRLEESDGATQDVAKTQRETLNAELSVARSNIEDVGIAIGSQLLPMLSTLTGWVSSAAERFQGLSDRQQKVIIVAGGLLAALGPILMMAGLLAQSIVALSGAYGVLTSAKATLAAVNTSTLVPSLTAVRGAIMGVYTALGPVGVALAAIGVAASALAIAWQTNFMDIRGHTEDAVNGVIGIIEWMVDKINSVLPDKWEIDFDAEEADFTAEAEEAEQEGEEAGEAAGAATTESLQQELENMDMEALGQQSGQEFGMGMESGMQSQLESDEPIKGWSPEIREALESGVEGYVSDPEEIEEAPTELNDALIDTVNEQQGGLTPENLGISGAEFDELMGIEGGAGTSSGTQTTGMSPSETAAMDMGSMQSTGSQSNGTLKKLLEEVKSLRAALEGPREIDGEVEFDPGEGLIQFVDGRIVTSETEKHNDFRA